MTYNIDIDELKNTDPETLETSLSLFKEVRDDSQEIIEELEELLSEMNDSFARMEHLQGRADPEQYDELQEMIDEHRDEIAHTKTLLVNSKERRDTAEDGIAIVKALLGC